MHPFFGDELLVDAGDEDLLAEGPFASPKATPATPAAGPTPLGSAASSPQGDEKTRSAQPSPQKPVTPPPLLDAGACGRSSPDIVL